MGHSCIINNPIKSDMTNYDVFHSTKKGWLYKKRGLMDDLLTIQGQKLASLGVNLVLNILELLLC